MGLVDADYRNLSNIHAGNVRSQSYLPAVWRRVRGLLADISDEATDRAKSIGVGYDAAKYRACGGDLETVTIAVGRHLCAAFAKND